MLTPEAVNATDIYRRVGFLTASGDIPFVGAAHFLAGADSDQTLVVIAFSFPNRSLTFARDGEHYRAAYDVSYDIRSGNTLVQHRAARSDVRVGSFRETTRSEESVIAQQILTLAPGSYTLEIATRDAGGTKTGKTTTPLVVPRFAGRPVLSVTPVYRVRPRTTRSAPVSLVVNPRSTVVFGRDSLLELYLETYGAGAAKLARLQIAPSGDGALYADSVTLSGSGDVRVAVARLPVSAIGFGVLNITVALEGAAAPVVRLPAVVRLGDELAVASFEEMLQYLRYFASAERLRVLRDTTPEVRPTLWSTFLRETDPNLATSENEALTEYLRRVQTANIQFREEDIPGWLTDRGKVYAAFGEADQITGPTGGDSNGRGMTLVWHYRQLRLELGFIDQTGVGQWRLTPPSEEEFDAAFKRLTSCASCR